MSEPDASAAQDDNEAELEAGDELQFDHAEYETPAPAGPNCNGCKRPIDDEYYEINGKVICATCRHQIEAAFRGGSRLVRVIKALVFGSVGAAAGAALYYAIIRVTGLNIGLVAVVVGLMVGGAVRKGTGNRGGLFYQFLAVFLAYTAIGAMNMPSLIEASDQVVLKHHQAQAVPEEVAKDRANEKIAEANKKDAVNPNRALSPRQRSVARFILLTFMIYASPLLMAYFAPISGLICCFALWAAWQTNKKARLVWSGPFLVSTADSHARAPEDVDHGE